MKVAKPLYKKEDLGYKLFRIQASKHSSFNYRPFSLLPSVSKLFETAMHSHILDYCKEYHIISDRQYDFVQLVILPSTQQ